MSLSLHVKSLETGTKNKLVERLSNNINQQQGKAQLTIVNNLVWNNSYTLKYNSNTVEEIKCCLGSIGEFQVYKPSQESDHKNSNRLALDINAIQIGSQTLFGAVVGSLGTIVGLYIWQFALFCF